MENVMDLMGSAFQSDTLSRLSSQFHESPSAIRRGLQSALPASVAALAAHVSSKQSAEDLLNVFRKGDYPHVDAGEVAQVAGDPEATSRLTQSSSSFLSRIFGNRLNGTVDAIASDSGIGRASATSLLSLAAPLVLGFFGKEAKSNNLDAGGLLRMLTDQGRKAMSALPGPLSRALGGTITATTATGALGDASGTIDRTQASATRSAHDVRSRVGDAAQHVRASAAEALHTRPRHEAEAPQARRGFWWALAAAAVLLLLAWRMFSHRGAATNEQGAMHETTDMQGPRGTEPNAPAYRREAHEPGAEQHAQPGMAAPSSPETDQRAATDPNPTQHNQRELAEPGTPEADQRAAAPVIDQRDPAEPTGQREPGEPSEMAPGGTPNEAADTARQGEAEGAADEGAEAQRALSLKSGAAPLTAALSGNTALPQSFTLHDVKFSTASAKLPKNAMLNEVADSLKQHESAHIRLEGFADARGTQEVNERLSDQRAVAVKDYLVARGVSTDQIETVGRATDDSTHASPQAHAENRRVDLVLLER